METALLLSLNRDLKVDGCQSNLNVMLKQLSIFFINLSTSFVGGIFRLTDGVLIIYFNLCKTTTFES